MSSSSLPDPMDVATDPAVHLLPRPDWERESQDDIVLVDSPTAYPGGHIAARIRFAPAAADRRIAEVRAWFAARQRPAFVWGVSPATEPADLLDRLTALGAVPFPDSPVYTPMVLDREPPAIPSGIEVRRVEDLVGFARMREVQFAAFGTPAERRDTARSRNAAEWERAQAQGEVHYVASVDGEPVGCAGLTRTIPGYPYLVSGATLPEARGRGVYRALVRARWDDAVAWGRPALTTSALETSRPILAHLGFRAGPQVHDLEDRSGYVAPAPTS